MIEVVRGLTPTHIAFNGTYGALTGDVRLGHGDWVWPDGKFGSPPDQGLETWAVAAGGTAAAVYTFRQPGTYAYVNHNLIKAFLFDARALIHVAGDWDDEVMTTTFEARPLVR
jgi:nitrite reductase (NO-forming)